MVVYKETSYKPVACPAALGQHPRFWYGPGCHPHCLANETSPNDLLPTGWRAAWNYAGTPPHWTCEAPWSYVDGLYFSMVTSACRRRAHA